MSEPAYDLIECRTREEWLKERRKGIGASEAAAVLGASPWKSAVELWGEKVGIVAPSDDESEWLKWGRRLETAIREGYMEETGRMVIRPGGPWTLVRSRKYPFLVTTLDGEIVPEDDRGPGVFESKTAMIFRKDEWAEEPPLQYTIQNQHQLLVTTWTWGADAVLLGGSRMLHTDFAEDQEFQELLLERLDAFWKLVQSETPPPMQGAEGSKELLLKLYPKAIANKVVPLPHEAITWDQTLQDVKAQLKALEEQKDKLTAMFAEAIGDAEAGALPSGDAYTYKLIEKKPYTVTPKPYRELRFKAFKEKR